MKTKIFYIFLVFPVFFISCEKLPMHPQPGTDNLSIYNEYANICIEKFGLEEVKGVDLEALADSIRPFITDELTDKELFDFCGIITTRMQEGHTNLKDLEKNYNASYYWFLGYPTANNVLLKMKYYYGPEANPDVQTITHPDSFYEILYGYLPQDKEIGYIYILSFNIDVSDEQFETMMEYLKDAKGIIIDVRSNLGGYINVAARMASYFTLEEVIFATNYIKNGPDPDNFAGSEMKLSPSGSALAYSKPVMVLHDRITFSSGSLFVVMMDPLDNTTTVGQIFGGGTGEIIDGFLSNGWEYNLSTSNLEDQMGRPTDPGIEANIPMIINPADTATDAIIERAILELNK
jgi:hypothetical protein